MVAPSIHRRKEHLVFFCIALFLCLPLVAGAQQSEPFPIYPSIRPNVAFWKNVYANYSNNTAIVHDSEDLSIVYETVELLDSSLPGAKKINSSYLKQVKTKYRTILEQLAKGKHPSTITENRVYALFSPRNRLNRMRQAASNVRIQNGLREQFIEGVIRSGAHIEKMKKIFQSYNLPEDLAYLPHVESSFNLAAYSKFGAAGMWQFTRETGKRFMTINYTLDERRDPTSSTHAAAKYLKQNFNNLGSWPLAITAYNYGHAGMLRAARREGNYENVFNNYKEGFFKFASRNFYSEFIAARQVAKALEKDITIRKHKPENLFTFELEGYASADQVANHFRIAPDQLKMLNPALRSPVWNGERYIPEGFPLRLPLRQDISSLAQAFPSKAYKKSQKRSHYYRVKRGDTASKIAQLHKVSLKRLSLANNLNKDAVVYIGQRLRIPGATSAGSTLSAGGSQTGKVPTLTQSKKILPSYHFKIADLTSPGSSLSPVTTVHKGGDIFLQITVEPEESLGIYAEWVKSDQEELVRLNHLSKAAINPGQVLLLPLGSLTEKAFEDLRSDFHQENEEDFFATYKITGFTHYKVNKGDTLWDICQNKFDLPLWLLKKYNSEVQLNHIAHNQRLKIPIVETL